MEYSYKFLPFLKIFKETKLKMSEKIIYFIIESLDNDNGCFASNSYFKELTGYSKKTCINAISSLREMGYIKVKQIRDPNNYQMTIKRIIHVTRRYIFKNSKKDNLILEKKEGYIIDKILFYYNFLELPKYKVLKNKGFIINAYNALGKENLKCALEEMSKSSFAMKNFSIYSVFKLKNLEKALNGYFKDYKGGQNENNWFNSHN